MFLIWAPAENRTRIWRAEIYYVTIYTTDAFFVEVVAPKYRGNLHAINRPDLQSGEPTNCSILPFQFMFQRRVEESNLHHDQTWSCLANKCNKPIFTYSPVLSERSRFSGTTFPNLLRDKQPPRRQAQHRLYPLRIFIDSIAASQFYIFQWTP